MNDNQIDWRETVETLLARSKRSFVPIDKSFVQLPRGNEERNSMLARFIRNGDLRGLKAYLLIAASTSSSDENGEWYTTLPLQTWARAFGCFQHAGIDSGKAAATKILSRLQQRKLIKRERSGSGREVKVRLLSQDGSGGPYQRPRQRFLRLSYEFWRTGLDEEISLPALAMLLVVLGEKSYCRLPSERMPEWYGWSADTAERGLHELVERGLVSRISESISTPLSPTGFSKVNTYTVLPPFDRESLNSSRRRRDMTEVKANE